ncbi:MAG: ROK family protein [SAR202 cluster bacterium]|jgi:glucokinase|nr:ROK family protein [SAR202 cluster bacterium]|tara:strand:- start:1265 stop:2233 length:969 start_codon:yes stop_codon:yes gene_type:complete
MPKQRVVFAIDIGGTKIRGAVVSESGDILVRKDIPSQGEKGEPAAMKRLAALLHKMCADLPDTEPVGIGMAIAGTVDPETGLFSNPPNLPSWHGTVPSLDLGELLGLPSRVHNDASLAALGEYVFGIGQGTKSLVMITLGTGVGGGIVQDGHLYGGYRGYAGEIGHLIVDSSGPQCACGGRGHLEMMASGTACARIAKERLVAGEASLVTKLVRGDLEKVRAETLVKAEGLGDLLAGEVLRDAADYVGVAVATLRSILDPELIVIGGGVSRNLHLFFPRLVASAKAHAMDIDKESCPVVTTVLGDDAGLLGAAALAWEKLGE